MKFLTLTGIELKKLRRSKIILILFAASVLLWLPSIFNAEINFEMQAEGISPENNFLIQGFMGAAWFMFPASMVVVTVLINQTERNSRGIFKMLTLPVNTISLNAAKFVVLLILAGLQILMITGMYFVSAAVSSLVQSYDFILPVLFVLKEAGLIFISSIPMLSVFWLLAVCIRTPVFYIGIGLASIVPSVLMINTKFWFIYPMDYPFFVITSEYGRLAENMTYQQPQLLPFITAACFFSISCIIISGMRFGRAERK